MAREKKGRLFQLTVAAFLMLPVMSSGCSTGPTAVEKRERDFSQACLIINNLPVDLASVWGPVAERAAAEGDSAGEAMAGYVRIQSAVVMDDVTDPDALALVDDYQEYWRLFERDLIAEGGVSPSADSPSTQLGARLLETCAPYHPGNRS